MRQDLTRQWTISELARLAHLSPSALYRAFVREVGKTPIAWLGQARVVKMAHLLRESTDTTETIARKVGWRNRSHASRQFKAHTGMTPSQYRVASPPKSATICVLCGGEFLALDCDERVG